MVKMVKLDDDTYVPQECCSFANPITNEGKTEIDDVDMPCGADCNGECSDCIIQRIMNGYAELTGQTN